MKKEEIVKLKAFEGTYNNGWIFSLKKVKELKKAIVSDETQKIQFWSDGTWICNEGSKEILDDEVPLFSLTKDDLNAVNQNTVKSMPFSICELSFGLDHQLCDLNIHEYVIERKKSDLRSFLNRDLFFNYYHSYPFDFNYNGIQFQCTIEWEKSCDYLRVKLDDETIGIAAGLSYMINYLFDLSEELPRGHKAYALFCKEIRKFEEFYCKTLYHSSISQTTTPTEVLIFQRKKSLFESGNFIKVADLINHFELDIPLKNKEDGEREIEFDVLFDTYHDLYGYMDVDAIKWAILNYLYDAEEKLSANEHKNIFMPSRFYDLLLQTNDINISYRIGWNINQEYFEVTNNYSQEKTEFKHITTLMYFFREITEKISNHDTRIIFYSKIVSFGELFYGEKPDYFGFDYILEEIESIERFINSEYFGLIPFKG
ncbi:MAG: hypothetical protein ACQEW2_17785 [Bacillota bacterium]